MKMHLVEQIFQWLSREVIFILPFALLPLLILSWTHKKVDLKPIAVGLKWFLVSYAFFALFIFIIQIITPDLYAKEFAILNRAKGPYAFAYIILFICHSIVPFLLLIKKIGTKIWILFLVTCVMNIGRFFEIFIILITSFHRDYLP